jgi:hypothetical protein
MMDLKAQTDHDPTMAQPEREVDGVKIADMKLKQAYPLLAEPQGNSEIDLSRWLPKNEKFVTEHLNKVGAILFRGFSCKSGEDFQYVVKNYSDQSIEYT